MLKKKKIKNTKKTPWVENINRFHGSPCFGLKRLTANKLSNNKMKFLRLTSCRVIEGQTCVLEKVDMR